MIGFIGAYILVSVLGFLWFVYEAKHAPVLEEEISEAVKPPEA